VAVQHGRTAITLDKVLSNEVGADGWIRAIAEFQKAVIEKSSDE
jgi:hypothetical protein